MISQTAEYALRAVVCLAAAADQRLTTPQIAQHTKVPEGYLAKVLQSLSRARIVRSQRGLGGGFTLARPAEQMSVLDVVNAVDPVQRITICPLQLEAHRERLCPLHRRLDDVYRQIEEAFRASTIAELLTPDEALTDQPAPLCDLESIKPPHTPPRR